jgi:DNA-binding NarL/FixJ family response regulator
MARILVIDDDPQVREMIKQLLIILSEWDISGGLTGGTRGRH